MATYLSGNLMTCMSLLLLLNMQDIQFLLYLGCASIQESIYVSKLFTTVLLLKTVL